jgi:hypothetical protein
MTIRGLLKAVMISSAIIVAIMVLWCSLARCGEADEANTYVLEDFNLRHAEQALAVTGHQVRCFDGVALGTHTHRMAGTALIILRGRDQRGDWYCYTLQAEEGAIKKIKVYPLKRPPAAWKGD